MTPQSTLPECTPTRMLMSTPVASRTCLQTRRPSAMRRKRHGEHPTEQTLKHSNTRAERRADASTRHATRGPRRVIAVQSERGGSLTLTHSTLTLAIWSNFPNSSLSMMTSSLGEQSLASRVKPTMSA
ncbi:hypothetical protein EYF80_060204 [Liparis tanakae]|uniref:Uncharacterized protein n=1 Tax=Liparis tanakae TaxID=230148 RepID=A0A4Z2EL78_9TELE|nr:hypothetical protein EYF80_060204 [Liparis tanakae]